MKIKDLFKRSIDRNIEGVVTIGNEADEKIFQELDEYVVTREIEKHFRTFFRKYRESINSPTSKMGVWITGFFGSGKSHFLKMLGYLLENKDVAGIKAPEFFQEKINDEIILADINTSANSKTLVVIFNIDSKAGSQAKTKPQAIMDVMLRTFNEAVGLSSTTPWVADMERELIKEGVYEEFQKLFESYSNKNWKNEGRNQAFLNRDSIIKALVNSRNMEEESAKLYFKNQVNNFSMDTERFAKLVNEYCVENNSRVAFLMDEVGQFVGNNTELMLNLQTCVEDLGRFCGGKAWVVVTSQQELKSMVEASDGTKQDFSKIQGRFDTRLLLSGANADEVIRQRILAKKEEVSPVLETLFETNEARLSNLIIFDAKPTWNGYKSKNGFVRDYPFVSYQFELLQKVFNAIREHGMTEGKHLSQNERSLLNAFQESSKDYANKELGVLVPFDSFFKTVDNFIDYDIKTVFTNAMQKDSLEEFDIRVLQLLFMIKYVKEMPATINRIATMMVTNINEDKLKLKEQIEKSLRRLEEETLIQVNGDTYDFLTNEEQDVNRQINNTAHDEGEIIRTISQIFYEVILQDQKIKYGKYEFPFNRFVDSHNIGQFNSSNITCKVVTGFYGEADEYKLAMESAGQETLIIDLQHGNYISELIRASKISVFRQNHLATMSLSLASILEKKQLELSDRRKRAEDSIKIAIKSAKLYSNGTLLDLGSKDGKERVFDALKKMVETKYYSLSKVKYSYDTINSILEELNYDDALGIGNWPELDDNKDAYEEIKSKLKSDKNNLRTSTVKTLVDYFGKAPYGWKELDVRGLIGVLWKHSIVRLDLHGKTLSISNSSDKYEFARGNKIDSISIKLQEKIDDETLNEIKRIVKNLFNENYSLNEEKMRAGIINIITDKIERLKNIQIKYGNELYPGKNKIFELHRELSSIIKNDDASYIFAQLIEKKDFLEENIDKLDEILSFYQPGSAQLQNYEAAIKITKWYEENRVFEDLTEMDELIDKCYSIINKEHPFGQMVELGKIVALAKKQKNDFRDRKVKVVVEHLEKDINLIIHEANQAKSKIEIDKLELLNDKLLELEEKYIDLLETVKDARNLDQYVTSSNSNVEGFKRFIATLLVQTEINKKAKRISLSSLVPVANKKITSKEDVEKVVDDIKKRLLEELKDTDEINID